MKCWHLVNSAGRWCWSGWISCWSWCKLQVCFTTLTWNIVIVNDMCSLESRRNLGWGLFWECFPLYYCRVKNPWQAILSLVTVPQAKIRISKIEVLTGKLRLRQRTLPYWFYKPVIGLWALQEVNAVQLAKHSVLYWLQEQAILYNNKVYWFNTLPSLFSPPPFLPPLAFHSSSHSSPPCFPPPSSLSTPESCWHCL